MSTTSVGFATIIPRSLPIVPCFANHFVSGKQVQESYIGSFILVEVSNDSLKSMAEESERELLDALISRAEEDQA